MLNGMRSGLDIGLRRATAPRRKNASSDVASYGHGWTFTMILKSLAKAVKRSSLMPFVEAITGYSTVEAALIQDMIQQQKPFLN